MGLGGARKPTAFARTHDCLYELIRWMSQARLDGDPDEAEAEAAFEAIWQERGPKDHAFAGDYRQLASRLGRSTGAIGCRTALSVNRSPLR